MESDLILKEYQKRYPKLYAYWIRAGRIPTTTCPEDREFPQPCNHCGNETDFIYVPQGGNSHGNITAYCVKCNNNSTPRKKKTSPRETSRYKNMKREIVEENNKCIICGNLYDDIHHIIPVKICGNNPNLEKFISNKKNCVPLCKKHHYMATYKDSFCHPNVEDIKTYGCCSICEQYGLLEKHQIVPSTEDIESCNGTNIIMLCHRCHRLAHGLIP